MGVDIGGSKGQELGLIALSNAHHSVNTGYITRMLGSVAHFDKLNYHEQASEKQWAYSICAPVLCF